MTLSAWNSCLVPRCPVILLMVLLIGVGGCSSVVVSYGYDPTTNLKTYWTYD
jgi:uncharacterized protein YceK